MNDFIEKQASDFANLKVDFVRGANPQLIMSSPEAAAETISIANWKAEDIHKYLENRLLA